MNNSEFGKLIKKARCEKGYTQNQLAELLSVTVSAVSKWENGKNLPDHQTLVALGKVLSLTLDEMYSSAEFGTDSVQNTALFSSTIKNLDATAQPTERKTLFHAKVFLLSIFLLIIVCFLAIVLQRKSFTSPDKEIKQIAFRVIEDSSCGTVYEVACVAHEQAIDAITLESSFITTLEKIWQNDSTVAPEIYIMKISFYSDEQQALSWDVPETSIYIVR